MGQLEQPKAEVAGMGFARNKLLGTELLTMAPSGILFRSQWS